MGNQGVCERRMGGQRDDSNTKVDGVVGKAVDESVGF